MRKKTSKVKPFELRKVTSRPVLGEDYSLVSAQVTNFGAALFLFIANDVHNLSLIHISEPTRPY